ncbi:protein-tyrosine phosphatase-like protein [Hyaloraphidium curvatum]|nr:protein-tyrosine phosphatase-like protein [Hyaloraphidium curvatum]
MVYICTTCGGPKCMYCGHNWKRWWHPEGARYQGLATDMPGVNATWVTSEMLALSRPSSRIIREYDLFQRSGVKLLINLTEHGEHPYCGDNLAPGSGFSYYPSEFEDHGIAYINPAWEDLGVPSLELMDSVVEECKRVVERGGKVATHCHAGMGRTGLVIACFLIGRGMDPEDALKKVRSRRTGAVQSPSQEEFLVRYKEFLDAKSGGAGKL